MSDTELIKIDKDGILTKSSCQLPDYPLKVINAKGTFLAQSEFNIVCGGEYPDGGGSPCYGDQPVNKCYKFDVNGWKKMPSMKIARASHGMTSTNDLIFVCGGKDTSCSTTSSCEKFENRKWISIQSLPIKSRNHCMITINNETILSIGGFDGSVDGSKVKR